MKYHTNIQVLAKSLSKSVAIVLSCILMQLQGSLISFASAETLCGPISKFSNTKISIIADGKPCPRGTKVVGSVLSKSEIENLIADAVGKIPLEPHRFSMLPEPGTPAVCQGIDIKSRCSDSDGCLLRYRKTKVDHSRAWWDEVRIVYDAATHKITLYWDGVTFEGTLGRNEATVLLTFSGRSDTYIATDKPTDGCVDQTNFIDDGSDTMWLHTTSALPLDGALFD